MVFVLREAEEGPSARLLRAVSAGAASAVGEAGEAQEAAMSRASEWAEKLAMATKARPREYLAPPTSDLTRKVWAGVTDQGRVKIAVGTESGVLATDIFLALCRWGIETFGDGSPS